MLFILRMIFSWAHKLVDLRIYAHGHYIKNLIGWHNTLLFSWFTNCYKYLWFHGTCIHLLSYSTSMASNTRSTFKDIYSGDVIPSVYVSRTTLYIFMSALPFLIYFHVYIIFDFLITCINASVLCQSECACLHKTINMVVSFVKSNENTYLKGRALMQMLSLLRKKGIGDIDVHWYTTMNTTVNLFLLLFWPIHMLKSIYMCAKMPPAFKRLKVFLLAYNSCSWFKCDSINLIFIQTQLWSNYVSENWLRL